MKKVLETMSAVDSLKARRLFEAFQAAQNLERLIASTPFIHRESLLDLADLEAEIAQNNWNELFEFYQEKYEQAAITLDWVAQEVWVEVPDADPNESGDINDSGPDENLQRDGGSTLPVDISDYSGLQQSESSS